MVKRAREESTTSDLAEADKQPAKVLYTNRQRVLILSSRGITARYRHLIEDFKKMIPHHKTDNKLDSKGDVHIVNEIADLKSCNQILYMETRKHSDLFMYLGKTPQGPSAKFHVVNIHTMEELKLTGNCMLGSRPLLNFDVKFDSSPHWQVMKSIFTDAFGTPRAHPKSKPFVDRIMSFYILNNNIWVRNYQIVDKSEASESGANSGNKNVSLVEIGPRFVLIPVRIFNGSMGGATLYQNSAYVSPNEERSLLKASKGNRYKERVEHQAAYKQMIEDIKPEANPLATVNMFKA
jgi:ribosome biogenesis protein BRX1